MDIAKIESRAVENNHSSSYLILEKDNYIHKNILFCRFNLYCGSKKLVGFATMVVAIMGIVLVTGNYSTNQSQINEKPINALINYRAIGDLELKKQQKMILHTLIK